MHSHVKEEKKLKYTLCSYYVWLSSFLGNHIDIHDRFVQVTMLPWVWTKLACCEMLSLTFIWFSILAAQNAAFTLYLECLAYEGKNFK
jgi:hypothetical protein